MLRFTLRVFLAVLAWEALRAAISSPAAAYMYERVVLLPFYSIVTPPRGHESSVVHTAAPFLTCPSEPPSALPHPESLRQYAVLLTMCIDRENQSVKSRQTEQYYVNALGRWLTETDERLRLYVVESCGLDVNAPGHMFEPFVNNPRLTVFSFDDPERKQLAVTAVPGEGGYKTVAVNDTTMKSIWEARAMSYAHRELAKRPEYGEFSHILKVTGRYFLKGVEDELRHLGNTGERRSLRGLYVQPHRFRYNGQQREQRGRCGAGGWQNSEYFLIKKQALDALTARVIDTKCFMEEALYWLSTFVEFCFLRGFKNDVPRGGDGVVYDRL